jgi:hypothetical protein
MRVTLRKDFSRTEVFGRIDMNSFLQGISPRPRINEDKGVIMAWLDPLKEPSRHFIADLAVMKPDFTAWKGNILLFFKSEKEKNDFMLKNKKDLPAYVNYLVSDSMIFHRFANELFKPVSGEFPVISYVNRKNEITCFSEGYRIGSGDGLLKAVIADGRH